MGKIGALSPLNSRLLAILIQLIDQQPCVGAKFLPYFAAPMMNVAFAECRLAARRRVHSPQWADLAILRLREIGPAVHHPTVALGLLRRPFGQNSGVSVRDRNYSFGPEG